MLIEKNGDAWVIRSNGWLLDSNGLSGSRGRYANRVRECFYVWTGQQWAMMGAAAKKFNSEQEAQQYLDEHFDELGMVLPPIPN
jgi:hypothetical protein